MPEKSFQIATILIIETLILLICIFGIWKLIQSQKKTNVIRLDKQSLLFPKIEGLKYFYEPIPNSVREDIIEWLPEITKQFINSDSINSDREISIGKKAGTYRIMTMGDSFTYGMYVNTKDNWPSKLEQKLNRLVQCPSYSKFEVINLGFPGFDIQHSVNRYKIRGEKYNPDLIIWFLKEDDFTQFSEISNKLAEEMTAKKKYSTSKEKVDDYIKYLDQSVKDIAANYSKSEIERTQNAFFSEFSSHYSGTLLLTTMPYTSENYKLQMQNWTVRRNNSYFLDKFSDLDIYKYPDGHPNVLGHQKIADITYEELVRTVFSECVRK